MTSTKNFELIWNEYMEFCENEEKRLEIKRVINTGTRLRYEKNDYMHFYDFLRYREEI